MSESKHTAGPWFFYELPRSDDGLGYIRCEGDSLDISHHGDVERSADENRTNARLIAAAPDLLEALKIAEGPLARIAVELRKRKLPTPELDAVRSAIAKAEGRS